MSSVASAPAAASGPSLPDQTGAVVEGPAAAAAMEGPADAEACGAVLIVAPVGREQAVSTAGLVVLSSQLAARGLLVMRLSLRGSGDSHDLDGDDVRAAWTADVRSALRDLRRRAPQLPLHAVGLRLGAAVLLDACAEDLPAEVPELRTAVLWEPLGGRAQLRRDVALRRVSVPREPVSDGVEVTGGLWSAGQAASLRTIPDPVRTPLPSADWSLRVEEDRAAAEMLWGVGSEFARVPRAAIGEIVDQLAEAAGRPPARCRVDLEPLSAAVVPRAHNADSSVRVLERFVRVADGRPAVLSTALPEAAQTSAQQRDLDSDHAQAPVAAASTAVQFIAASAEPADGPTGLWASTARDLAGAGLTVLRAERPGSGVLTDPRLETSPMPYDQDVIRAVRSDAHWLHETTGLPVTAVGLCVGSWLALRAADSSVTERVIAVNNVAWRPGTGYYELIYSERGSWEGAPRSFTEALARDARTEAASPSAAVRVQRAAKSRLSGLRDVVERRAPGPVRHLLAMLGLSGSVSSMLTLPGGVREIDLLLGAEDMAEFHDNRGDWGLRMARRLGRRVRVHDVPSLDHALLAAAGRREVRTMLRDMLAPKDRDGDRGRATASGDAQGTS
ncbi:hypothetical protein M3E18_03510 [Kocuria sp. p3-SID1433]|uniref:hypothetical protein n=1 Tax=unclassified Kocuria TaxID=2649579 RepID=UPI0021A40C22|nr:MULTISPECIES: hypothetical protein [unclassified Kocuria]MCT1602131.1 hypothetical protein [Kocuria sp. p3-SID1428]MCT2179614.1 hypothetical protein [Kocuria sp. p3-SID1433]